MKWYFAILSLLLPWLFPASVLGEEIRYQTGFNYDWWASNGDDKGSQLYIPLQAAMDFAGVDVSLTTAFAATTVDLANTSSRSINSLIDTKINSSYKILDRWPFDVLVGLDVNLPTGKTELDQEELRLIIDPDLVSIKTLGEGFNLNPTISAAWEWESWEIGGGIGYLWRGEYDYSVETNNYDPGDMFNLTGEVVYFANADLHLRLHGEFGFIGKDQVDGVDVYQEGDFILLGIKADYFQENWAISFGIHGLSRGKSKSQTTGAALLTESKNSYGDEFLAHALVKYYLNRQTTLNGSVQFLHNAPNDYPESDPLYIGQRRKLAIAGGVAHKFANTLEARLNLVAFIMEDERNWFHDTSLTYRGTSLQARLGGAF